MNDLVSTLNLRKVFDQESYTLGKADISNFESLYSKIHSDPNLAGLRKTLENHIQSYFEDLILPDEPTIYDYLLLSLRSKDVVATFNWDPLLVQAYERNRDVVNMPDIRFLHGNVAVGYCPKDGAIAWPNTRCPNCSGPISASNLLYPINQKNYNDDAFLKGEWDAVEYYVRNSYFFTIFGYGAPASDTEARELLKNAWSNNVGRELLQLEIIDTKPKSYLEAHWKGFYYSGHWENYQDYWSSFLAKYPRRTCENIRRPIHYGQFPLDNPAPRGVSLYELQSWAVNIAKEEG